MLVVLKFIPFLLKMASIALKPSLEKPARKFEHGITNLDGKFEIVGEYFMNSIL